MNGKLQDLVCSEAFEQVMEPVVSFVFDSGEIFGALLTHLTDAHYYPNQEKLVLRWPVGTVEIRGPKSLEFYKAFAKGKGNWCRADGVDVKTVAFVAAPKRP